MADENNNNVEGIGLNRRNFLKSAGVVVTGSTLRAGLTLATGAAAEKEVPAPKHAAAAHPGGANLAATKLKVNGENYEVQIEPNWTLQRTLQFKLHE